MIKKTTIKDYFIIFLLAFTVFGLMIVSYKRGMDKVQQRLSYEFYKPDTVGVKILHLNADPYDVDVKVIITTDLTKAAALLRYYTWDRGINEGHLMVRGITIWPNDSVPGLPCIWIPSIPKTPEELGIVSHELIHLTHILMSYVGVTLSEHSEEAYAYEMGYLTRQFYEQCLKLK